MQAWLVASLRTAVEAPALLGSAVLQCLAGADPRFSRNASIPPCMFYSGILLWRCSYWMMTLAANDAGQGPGSFAKDVNLSRNFAKFLQRHRFRNMKHWSADVARRAGSAEQS